VLGRALSSIAIRGSATVVLVIIGLVFCGASFGAGLWLAMPALLLAMLSMIGIAFLVSSAVLLIKEPNFFVDATNFLFAMASGVAFPITVLPFFIRPVAYLLPTTYALDLLRLQALGTHPLAAPAVEWLALVAFAVATVWVGRWAFLRTEHRMRIRGTLGQH
jgi:ABC-2 type transport system permease protein